jgi:uncharacterized protein YjbI with pentapeptide repeats
MKNIEGEELKEILKSHKKWLNAEDSGVNASLRGVDLTKTRSALARLDLRYADFSGASLEGMSLSESDFRGSDFSGAKMRGATLNETAFNWACLRGADLRDIEQFDVIFRNADLCRADFRNADLHRAILAGANLSEANLSGSCLSCANLRAANLSKAGLTGADLSGSKAREADLNGAEMGGADLRNADLSKANLFKTNLSKAVLAGSNLSGANFIGADLFEADLTGANLTNTVLRGANLRNADFTGAELGGTDFQGAIVTGAKGLDEYLARDVSTDKKTGLMYQKTVGDANQTAREIMGNGTIVTSAHPGRTYRGELVAVIGSRSNDVAVMAISDQHAILHDIRKAEMSAGFIIGEQMTLVTDADGYSAVQAKDETISQKREGMKL